MVIVSTWENGLGLISYRVVFWEVILGNLERCSTIEGVGRLDWAIEKGKS
jgi:hypothetical protein